jgi:hypothetical protein
MMTEEEENTYYNAVRGYLIHQKEELGTETFGKLIIFQCKASDILKFIERPQDCNNWPHLFYLSIEDSVQKIHLQYILKQPYATFTTT